MFGLFRKKRRIPLLDYAAQGYVMGAIMQANPSSVDFLQFSAQYEASLLKDGATLDQAASGRWGLVYAALVHNGEKWCDAMDAIKQVRVNMGKPRNFETEDEVRAAHRRAATMIIADIYTSDDSAFEKFLKALGR